MAIRRKSKAGGYARGAARRRYVEVLRGGWRTIVPTVFVYYVVILLMHRLWPGIFGDVFLGAMLVLPLWAISVVAMSDPSAASWARGADSEEWTAAALRRHLPDDYRVVHDVQLGRANADHVVVGPAGVFVVETKWSSKPWATERGFNEIRIASKQCRSAARRVQQLLDEAGVSASPTPVVVLWGGRTSRWARERALRSVDGTAVVAGVHIDCWTDTLSSMSTQDIDSKSATRALLG